MTDPGSMVSDSGTGIMTLEPRATVLKTLQNHHKQVRECITYELQKELCKESKTSPSHCLLQSGRDVMDALYYTFTGHTDCRANH